MKFIIILLSVLLTTKAIAQTITDHSAHVGAVPNTPSQDSAVMPDAQHTSAMIHGDTLNYLLLAERVEYLKSDSFLTLVWDMQGWVGNDYHKLWLKTEGAHDNEADSHTSTANTTASKQKVIAWKFKLCTVRPSYHSGICKLVCVTTASPILQILMPLSV